MSKKLKSTTTPQKNRLSIYSAVASELAFLSDQRLLEVLEKAKPLGTSIGGVSSLLTLGDTNIFVKKIRLTDIERQPEHIMSTANMFQLPLYFQYGIGSTGFGAWRELCAHIMSTNWVISGECSNFPVMYHWRILPSPQSKPSDEEMKELERNVDYWDGEPAIRTRLLANQNASANIVLFLEYIPINLHQWFTSEVAKGEEAAAAASSMIDNQLKKILSFINAHGLLHFDAHFWNILTDGKQLYLSDFGLALSSKFELSKSEREFFKKHQNYDQCSTAFFLTEWILTSLFEEENRDAILNEYAAGKGTKIVPPAIADILSRYAPTALIMDNFYKTLKTESKEAMYPASKLKKDLFI